MKKLIENAKIVPQKKRSQCEGVIKIQRAKKGIGSQKKEVKIG
jgi:hypothetical protein